MIRHMMVFNHHYTSHSTDMWKYSNDISNIRLVSIDV